MAKSKMNITMDEDLIDFAKRYASEQRTTVSELFSQFVLNLKRHREDDPTEVILGDPAFRESLLHTLRRMRSGRVKWSRYDEVF
jgi:hypothetical protein